MLCIYKVVRHSRRWALLAWSGLIDHYGHTEVQSKMLASPPQAEQLEKLFESTTARSIANDIKHPMLQTFFLG